MKLNSLSNTQPKIIVNNNIKQKDKKQNLSQTSDSVSFKGSSIHEMYYLVGAAKTLCDILHPQDMSKFVKDFMNFPFIETFTTMFGTYLWYKFIFTDFATKSQTYPKTEKETKPESIKDVNIETITDSYGIPDYIINNDNNLIIHSQVFAPLDMLINCLIKGKPQKSINTEKEDLIALYKAYNALERNNPKLKKYHKELLWFPSNKDNNDKRLLLILHPQKSSEIAKKLIKSNNWEYSIIGTICEDNVTWYKKVSTKSGKNKFTNFIKKLLAPKITPLEKIYIGDEKKEDK